MTARPAALALAIFAAVSLVSPPARAQQPQRLREQINADGKLQNMRPGLLHMVTGQNEQWLVKVDQETREILYTASAKPSWLRPGMWVSFQGLFDKRGSAAAPIGSVTVFTPSPQRKLGIYSETTSNAAGFFSEKPAANEPAKPKPTTAPLEVAGQLVNFRNGEMEVSAGGAVVKAKLADNAIINVELSDYTLARQGDTVSVRGWYYDKGQAWANTLVIRSDRPLEGAVKTARRVFSEEERKRALADLGSLAAGESAVFGEAAAEAPAAANESNE